MKVRLNTTHLLGQSLPQRIAIVRSLPGLGDLLCCIPALRALRTALPEAHITLIGLPWSQQFVQRFHHYFDAYLEFPGYPGIPEVPLIPQRIVTFLAQAQQLNFDLALQLHGTGTYINSFVMLLGAKQSAGFFPADQYCPDPTCFLPYPEQESEIWRQLRLLEFLGIPLQGDALEFPIAAANWQEWQAIASVHGLVPQNYVCVHPGASVSARRWSPQQFAEVADALSAQGLKVVLTGTAAEIELTRTVAKIMRFPAIDLAGETSLGSIAALLKQARLLISNDTGVSHLAAALQVKSVVIFSNSDPHRWAPLDRRRHRVVVDVALNTEAIASMFPLATPDSVISQAIDLLHREVAYAS